MVCALDDEDLFWLHLGKGKSMTQEALKLALALVTMHHTDDGYAELRSKLAKEALAQTQEPVAWMHVQGNYKEPSFRELADDEVERGWEQHPLYNIPPQRTWVGLTDEDCKGMSAGDKVVAMWADRTLKEKNT